MLADEEECEDVKVMFLSEARLVKFRPPGIPLWLR